MRQPRSKRSCRTPILVILVVTIGLLLTISSIRNAQLQDQLSTSLHRLDKIALRGVESSQKEAAAAAQRAGAPVQQHAAAAAAAAPVALAVLPRALSAASDSCAGLRARAEHQATALRRLTALSTHGLPSAQECKDSVCGLPADPAPGSSGLPAKSCSAIRDALDAMEVRILGIAQRINVDEHLRTQGSWSTVGAQKGDDGLPLRAYSQSGQDLWLRENVFGEGPSQIAAQVREARHGPAVHAKTFVEIGAFNGIGWSNSMLFEQNSWRGLCIEGHPKLFADLERNRPLCVNVHTVVANEPGAVVFAYPKDYKGPLGTSGIEVLHKDLHRLEGESQSSGSSVVREEVQATPMRDLFAQYGWEHIGLFCLDVEGAELHGACVCAPLFSSSSSSSSPPRLSVRPKTVLKTIDFNKVKIDVVRTHSARLLFPETQPPPDALIHHPPSFAPPSSRAPVSDRNRHRARAARRCAPHRRAADKAGLPQAQDAAVHAGRRCLPQLSVVRHVHCEPSKGGSDRGACVRACVRGEIHRQRSCLAHTASLFFALLLLPSPRPSHRTSQTKWSEKLSLCPHLFLT